MKNARRPMHPSTCFRARGLLALCLSAALAAPLSADLVNITTPTVATGTGYSLAASTTLNNTSVIGGTNASNNGTGVQVAGAGTLVINAPNGLIHGGAYGVNLGAYGGGIDNSGTIIGADASGIGVNSNANATLVSNTTGGLIRGSHHGVRLRVGGTVLNSGTILGVTLATGVYADAATFVDNTTDGLIQGVSSGVWLEYGGTVSNAGTISGTKSDGDGIFSNRNATLVSNTTGGLIQGRRYGAQLRASGTISNSGTISGGTTGIYSTSNAMIVTNTGDGLVKGGQYGVWLVNGGTIVNSAMISGGTAGIYSSGAVTLVTNTTSGLITGGTVGVWLRYGGALNNSGTISGDSSGGIGVNSNGRAEITNSGHIEGYSRGISLGTGAAGGTITNTGTIRAVKGSDAVVSATTILVTNTAGGLIDGSNIGVWLQGGGTVANHALITGGTTGIRLDRGGRVTNTGTIKSAAAKGAGILSSHNATHITNESGALIQGGTNGVNLAAGGTVTNFGLISGTSSASTGILSNGANTSIDNRASGLISGTNHGVSLNMGGTLTNAGAIVAVGGTGVYSNNNATRINNSGLIQGHFYAVSLNQGGVLSNSGTITGIYAYGYGIYSNAAALVSNTDSGLIRSYYGVYLNAGGMADNSGTISASNIGVYLKVGGTVNNTGLISGGNSSSYGIYSTGSAVFISNDGQVQSTNVGVRMAAGGTVLNAGAITGTAGAGVLSNNYATLIDNTGLVSGTSGVRLLYGGTVSNSGTILGNARGIYGEVNASRITNESGALIQGDHGMYFNSGGETVTNSGSIVGTDYSGIWSSGGIAFTNAVGALLEGHASALFINGGGTISNEGTINVTGTYNSAVTTGGAGTRIDNGDTGLIRGGGDGIVLFGGGTVANSGAIVGINYGAIRSDAAALVTNSTGALIQGGNYGVRFLAGGTVTNSGTITGGGDGIYTGTGGPAIVTNTTGGVISGGTNAIYLAADAANEVHLWNSGTLNGNLNIAGAASQLTLNGGAGSAQNYSDAVTGDTTFSGTLIKQGAGAWTIDKDPGAEMKQQITLVKTGTLIVAWDKYQLSGSAATIDAGATLQISATADATVGNAITGAGQLDLANTNTDTNAATIDFTLGANTGANFTGTVNLRGDNGWSHLVLDDNAQATLAGATLRLDEKGSTTIDATVTGTIGTLDLAGGALIVVTNTTVGSGTAVIPSVLNTGTLVVSNTTATQIHVADTILNGLDTTGTLNGHLFDVDVDIDGANKNALIVKTDVLGAGATAGVAFTVKDAHGNEITPSSGTASAAIENAGGNTIGNIYYGYTATVVDASGTLGAGIALGYGVNKIESTTTFDEFGDTGGITLDSAGSVDKTLGAQLSGAGDFAFTGGGTLSLGHTGNDYEGASLITGTTTVRALADNALGYTASLAIGEKSALDLNNHVQTVLGDTTLADEARISLGGEDAVFEIAGNLTGDDSVQLHADGGFMGAAGDITLGHNATIDLGASTGIFGANGSLATGTAADINLRGGAMVAADMTFGDDSIINFGTSTGMVITRDNLTTGTNTVINAQGGEIAVAGTLYADTGAAINLDSGVATVGGIDVADTAAINLDDSGVLNISGNGTLHGDNALTGGDASTLTVAGESQLDIHGANTGFTGNVQMGGYGTWGDIYLADLAGLGNSGTVFLNADGDGSGLYLDASGTFAKTLAGASGWVTIEDGQTVHLTADNTNFAATFEIYNSGTLRAQNQAALGSALVSGSGNDATLRLEGYTDTLRNELADNLAVHVAESSTVTIARDNSGLAPNARAVIDAGSALALTGSSAMGDASLLTNDGHLAITHADAVVASATLANNADLYISYGGTVSNPFVSAADATVTLDADGYDMALASNIGAGSLVLPGSGVTTIAVAQTHAGATLVENGTLRAGMANILATSSALTLRNATLDLNNHAQTMKALHAENAVIRYHSSGNTGITTLTLASLDGTTTSHMNVDLAGKNTDTLTIQGAASGTHNVIFNPVTDPTLLDDPLRTYALKVIDYTNGDPVFTSNGVESGMHTYQLHKGDGGLILPDKNAYYLSGGDALSRAADAILLTAGVMGADWHYNLDNVHKRLGEIRVNLPVDTGNVWARVNNYRLNASAQLGGSTFEQDSYGVTAGGDKIFRRENAVLIAGAYLGMSRSDRTFDDARNQYGDGKSSMIGAGLYALWLYDNAWFVDATLRFDRSTNELNARGVDGFVSRGKYTNQTQGLSVEFGRRLMNGRYWVEPSAQVAVAWINGADYTVSNGVSRDLQVHIGDSDAWQYRGQLRTGADYGRWQPYLKFAAVKSDTGGGRVTVEGRSYQPWFDGWRMEAGAGVGYLIDARSQVYFDYEYNKATRYERPWSMHLGYRRAW